MTAARRAGLYHSRWQVSADSGYATAVDYFGRGVGQPREVQSPERAQIALLLSPLSDDWTVEVEDARVWSVSICRVLPECKLVVHGAGPSFVVQVTTLMAANHTWLVSTFSSLFEEIGSK